MLPTAAGGNVGTGVTRSAWFQTPLPRAGHREVVSQNESKWSFAPA